MKKIILIFSLIVVAVGLYNPFPQFTQEQMQQICIEEGIY